MRLVERLAKACDLMKRAYEDARLVEILVRLVERLEEENEFEGRASSMSVR